MRIVAYKYACAQYIIIMSSSEIQARAHATKQLETSDTSETRLQLSVNFTIGLRTETTHADLLHV